MHTRERYAKGQPIGILAVSKWHGVPSKEAPLPDEQRGWTEKISADMLSARSLFTEEWVTYYIQNSAWMLCKLVSVSRLHRVHSR